MPSSRRLLRASATTIALTAALTGCTTSDEKSPSAPATTQGTSQATPSTASTPTGSAVATDTATALGPLLTVTIQGDDVQPNAEEIDLSTGEKLLIEIESDRAGELHVHSTPEQFIEFDAGTTHTELALQIPGSVEVEDHDTGAVVALIEVR